jgi:hypothetical protein
LQSIYNVLLLLISALLITATVADIWLWDVASWLFHSTLYEEIIQIVADTTRAIWECLHHEYMPVPNEEGWGTIAHCFHQLWNLPKCVGAIDGKHIRIQKLSGSGSTTFNYKSYHSLVLMAFCNADVLFTTTGIGHTGRNSDGGVFQASRLGH